jgi:pimeloyl-ACP methyl ester carboxylesterase
VFNAEVGRSFTGGQAIEAPVTVTWHTRDPLFAPRRCTTAELPPHTRVLVLHGCGHVPTWDDPPLVLETIRATVAATSAAAPAPPVAEAV